MGLGCLGERLGEKRQGKLAGERSRKEGRMPLLRSQRQRKDFPIYIMYNIVPIVSASQVIFAITSRFSVSFRISQSYYKRYIYDDE